jgi:hypothetical protein
MKKFLTIIVVVLLLFLLCGLTTFYQADGYADSYYLKVTTPKQSSLILGTSKATQGIQPQALASVLGDSIYNYSFNIGTSPFGPAYLENVKNKLDDSSEDGIFILAVDPWSLSVASAEIKSIEQLRERNSFIARLSNVSSKPNIGYLLNHFNGSYYGIFSKNSPAKVEDDGWLHVSLDLDEESVERRREFTLKSYQGYLETYQLSDLRIEYLKEMIEYLDHYGDVYLVRLPVHPELQILEDSLSPAVNDRLKEAITRSSGYLDFTKRNEDFNYTDGVHLTPESGELVSREIALWISELK